MLTILLVVEINIAAIYLVSTNLPELFCDASEAIVDCIKTSLNKN